MPRVSVLMPLFNGKRFIKESLDSIEKQTFKDWEFIIVNDFGSDDGCADVVKEYAQKDDRIKLVQAEERLGLAASLNVGLDMAQGDYVARVDVDDPSEPERLEKQVKYMDAHPEVSLCGVWQRSVTPKKSYVQKVAFEADELKAAMMFGCEISHCGVMLRKADFDTHGWRYNPSYLGEDYELWTRILAEGAIITNIPEVLVNHRWGFENISIAKGENLRTEVQEISARSIKTLGVQTDQYDRRLFAGWRARPEEFAKKHTALFLQQGYRLLQEIWEKNSCVKYCDPAALKKVLLQRWDWIRESCGLKFKKNEKGSYAGNVSAPTVSVILPTFCSALDISQAIDSIRAQTFENWEMLVVNDWGSDDGTAEIARMYAWEDSRIRLIQADSRLGLAESLNLGMREAKGKYLARIDADDTSKPERLEKQVKFMDDHDEVGICGTWQHHYGKDIDFIHRAASDPKVLRCRLLFWCDLCHSTLMLRRDAFINNGLFYDPDACAEDYELWTRAMEFMEIANIPEVLGEYREGTGITSNKIQQLAEESGRITARTIKRTLGIDLSSYDFRLLNRWINPISKAKGREEDLDRLKTILKMIWEKNKNIHFFDSQILLQTLAAQWHWAKDDIALNSEDYNNIKKIEDVFDSKYKPSLLIRYKMFKQNNPQLSVRIKKIVKRYFLRPPARLLRRIVRSLMKDCIDDLNQSIERWTWNRFQRARNELIPEIDKSIERWTREISLSNYNMTPYNGGKIRILFLFQAASFWPSWESFYNSCLSDERFEVVFALLDEKFGDTDQMHTNKQFLDNNNIPYVIYSDELLLQMQPHILVLQTPYDQYHRAPHVRSAVLKKQGARIVYITYGIELADTEVAHKDHYLGDAIINSWRIYTFSRCMQWDYMIYSPNGKAVRCVGHPKFDGLYHSNRFSLSPIVEKRARGRKIVVWHTHFPKFIPQANGKKCMATPYLEEYKAFAEYIITNQDFFFVFLPHPKFLYEISLRAYTEKIMSLLSGAENAFVDLADDYRSSIVNADFIITDRSALMVEAGSVGVPVLYMHNPDYEEPLTKAIEPLVESYYQGTGCADMIHFLDMCRRGEDPLKENRAKAFAECVPFFDGKCGERIKEDIVESLNEERQNDIQAQIVQQNIQLEERLLKLEQVLHDYISQDNTHNRE